MTQFTCWTMIEGAAAGDVAAREGFVSMYLPVVRAYLRARWRGTAIAAEVDDAAQEVFLECFRDGGALERAERCRGQFRPYLYGLVRNVALRIESGRARDPQQHLGSELSRDLAAREETLSKVFDREWARGVMLRAGERMRAAAEASEGHELRRVELLRLHLREGLSIREIARRWEEDPHRMQREFVKAQGDFRRALLEEIGFDVPGSKAASERECERLLALLA